MALFAPHAPRRPRRTLWVWLALLTGLVALCLWPTMAVELRLREPVGPAPAGGGEEA